MRARRRSAAVPTTQLPDIHAENITVLQQHSPADCVAGEQAFPIIPTFLFLPRPSSHDRPPSASRPGGSAGRGRRRPRSASAAITPTQRRSSLISDPPACTAPSGGKGVPSRTGRETLVTHHVVRPASAACTGGPRAHPPSSRPSRPRPLTATGTTSASKRTAPQHHGESTIKEHHVVLARKPRRNHGGYQRQRRVVSAGSVHASPNGVATYPWNSSTGDRNMKDFAGPSMRIGNATHDEFVAKRPASRCVVNSSSTHSERLGTTTTAAAAGSGFFHEHKNLGGDPEVMQRATAFVTKILQTRGKEGGKENGQPSHQPQLEHNTQGSSKTPYMKTSNIFTNCTARSQRLKPTGAATRCKDRRLGRGRRRRHKSSKKSAAVAIGTVAGGREVSKGAAVGGESGTALLALSEQQQRHLQQQQEQRSERGDTTVRSTPRCAFPFPPSGTDNSLDELIGDDGDSSKVGEADTARLAADGVDNDGVMKPKSKSSLGLTPLAFDVFCSLRPTLLKDTSTKHCRQDPNTATATKVVGLPNSTRGKGQNARGEKCRRRTPRGQERPVSASAVPPLRELADHTAACTWTSVFGALCAGAERGRARAEVLQAARRASSRSKQRQRRAPAVAAAPAPAAAAAISIFSSPRMNVVRDCGTTAFGTNVVRIREDDGKTVCREKYDAIDSDVNAATSGRNLCPELRVELLGDEDACPPHSLETRSEGAPIGQQLTAEVDDLLCDSVNAPRMLDVMGTESCEQPPGDGCQAPLAEGTDADPPMQHEGCAMAAFPLFRHPFGGGTTLIGVNAPRSLQVCPGDNGFSGLGSKVSRHCFSFSRRRHSREGKLPRRASPRRPSTASGALSSGRTTSGTDGCGESEMGAGPGVATAFGMRPETAESFFSAECASRHGIRGDAPWTNESDNR